MLNSLTGHFPWIHFFDVFFRLHFCRISCEISEKEKRISTTSFKFEYFRTMMSGSFFLMDKPPAQAVTGAFTSFQSFSNKASRSSFHSIELLAFKSHKTVRAFEELRSVSFSITKWKRAQRHTQMKPIERRQQQDKSVKETPELGNNLLGVSFNFYCRHCLVYFYFTSVKMIC